MADTGRESPRAGLRPDFSESGRPPWDKPMTKDEWDDFLALAREIGNPVEGWAVHVYYIETALADRVFRLERALGVAAEVIQNVGEYISAISGGIKSLHPDVLASLERAAEEVEATLNG